jgi:hypothetical protein
VLSDVYLRMESFLDMPPSGSIIIFIISLGVEGRTLPAAARFRNHPGSWLREFRSLYSVLGNPNLDIEGR